MAYVKNRFIGEGETLISDILEMTESLNLKGCIVTVDIEKGFDSISHSFLLACLKKYGKLLVLLILLQEAVNSLMELPKEVESK